ncbi:MAG: hypothetical protein JXR20_09150 [Balneola sp.]
MKPYQRVVSVLLSICILGTTTVSGFGAFEIKKQQEVVRVAYIGIEFEGVSNDIQDNINKKVSSILKAEGAFFYKSKENIEEVVDQNLRKRLSMAPVKEDLQKIGNELYVDHLFLGFLENQSNTDNSIILNGYIIRYDVASDILYTLDIKSFYEELNEELEKFDEQLVQTIKPKKKKGFIARHLPGIIMIGITIVASVLLLGSTGGQGSANGGGGRVPIN